MKKVLLIGFICFSFIASSKNIVNYDRTNGGRNGYKTVNQTYNGTVNGQSAVHLYSMYCADPGLERCHFMAPTLAPPLGGSQFDEIAEFYGAQAMNDFADLAENQIVANNVLSGNFIKTLEVSIDGVDYFVFITLTWEVSDISGDYNIVGTTEAFLA